MDRLRTSCARLAVTAALRAGVVLAGFAAAVLAASAAWGAQDAVLSLTGSEGGDLVVEGGIDGVRAGGPSAPLRLTLRNPGDTARRVTRVTAHPSGGTPACPASYLRVGAWAGDVTVPARGSATVTVPVTLDARARCAGAAWTLAYTAHSN